MSIQELTAHNFDDMVDHHSLIVIDFCADWCQPCKAFEKIMLNIASDYPDVAFARVNVEKEKAFAEEFAVRTVPFVMIIKNRTALYADSGVLSQTDLRAMLDKAKKLNV